MRVRTRLLATAVVSMAALPAIGTPAASAPGEPRASATVDAAVAWLDGQQQADGGFEVAGFPGFETSDAILALAAAGQSGTDWDEAEALAAVTAVTTAGGLDPLDGLDDWIDSVQGDAGATVSAKAAQAAKVVSLVTVPLGLDPTDVDPSGDTAGAVDLIAAIEAAAGTGDYAALASVFTARVYALWALAAAGEPVPAALVTAIEAAQQPDGGFSYTGDPTMPSLDVDVTAAAVIALAVAGEADGDVVADALAFLARTQTWTGDWPGGFDDGNPNSTATGPPGRRRRSSATRTRVTGDRLADIRFIGQPFPSPAGALEDRQAGDGHIAGPGDAWGLNTFGTTQAIQGLMAADGVWPYRYTGPCGAPSAPANNRRLVNGHYLDLLSRFSDEAGADFWVGQLDGGMSPAQVSRRLTGTSEYGRRVVDRLATDYLGRDRDRRRGRRRRSAGDLRSSPRRRRRPPRRHRRTSTSRATAWTPTGSTPSTSTPSVGPPTPPAPPGPWASSPPDAPARRSPARCSARPRASSTWCRASTRSCCDVRPTSPAATSGSVRSAGAGRRRAW